MSEFTSGFWEYYVGIITVVSILACAVLLKSMSTRSVSGEEDTTGHIWDEDLVEHNHPLPLWWIWLFYITIAFSLAYLLFYPGLGLYAGSLKWTSKGEYEAEMKAADERFGPLYQKFASQDLRKLAADPEARALGQKLFLNNCAQCHGSDAAGGKGFPNLTDHDWLYGGEPETIKASIMNGRNGVMPALGLSLGPEGTLDAANYVLSLSGAKHDPSRAARGKQTFTTVCAACHGPEGRGNQQIGAPNLTDNIWEYGGSLADVVETITRGRGTNALTPGQSAMPAHKDSLGEAKVHILAAYVWGLSNPRP
jgi:cytochrome c oxidase cbb3-type subunit 3